MQAADDDLKVLIAAMHEAGHVALAFHQRNPRHWQKPDGSIVTEADLAVNDSLTRTLSAARPEDAILSEETPDSESRMLHRRLWIIDPIDGTRNFFNGGMSWCIGVALVEDGQPVLSALHQPAEQRTYRAVRGGGAFCNNKRLLVNEDARNVIGPKLQHPALNQAGLTPQGSADLALLLRFAMIAEGRLAGTVSIGNKKDWDIAAGHLLLTEAGGLATTLDGQKIVYNQQNPWQPGLVAATAATHSSILKAVGKK